MSPYDLEALYRLLVQKIPSGEAIYHAVAFLRSIAS